MLTNSNGRAWASIGFAVLLLVFLPQPSTAATREAANVVRGRVAYQNGDTTFGVSGAVIQVARWPSCLGMATSNRQGFFELKFGSCSSCGARFSIAQDSTEVWDSNNQAICTPTLRPFSVLPGETLYFGEFHRNSKRFQLSVGECVLRFSLGGEIPFAIS